MSARYLGGIVSRDPLTLNPAAGNAANGVFTLEQYMQAVKNATWPGFDPYFNETVLLLHGNGTNGAQNNTFLDGSTNNFTITRNGNTTQGTFSPFSVGAGQWSSFINNANSYVSYGSSADYTFGTGDFTVEAWVYISSIGASQVFSIFNVGGALTGSYALYVLASAKVESTRYGDGAGFGQTTGTINFNTWNHIAAVRSGGTAMVYINGVADSGATYSMGNITASAGETGRVWQTGYTSSGYVSNLRVCKGTAVYTSNFTPSTSPFTSTSQSATNCVLLTLQSNRFVDTNTAVSAKTVTLSGSPSVTPFSPFAPTAAYSAGTNGGSGYFDGTGDYLSGIGTTSSFNFLHNTSALFTVQAWVYLAVGGSSRVLIDTTGNSGSNIGVVINTNTSNQLSIVITRGVVGSFVLVGNSTGSLVVGAWNHVAITYDQSLGSNNAVFYINGVQSGTQSKTGNTPSSSNATYALACGGSATGGEVMNGYIANLRIDNSIESITLPTTPLSTVTNTKLLLNFTNAGIFDNTGKNNLETVGNAQIDTAVKKFGDGSLEFDGNGDYLQSPNSMDFNFGGGDFTIEFWMYASAQAIAAICHQTSLASNTGWVVWNYNGTNPATNTRLLTFMANGASFVLTTTSDAYTDNTWTHIAVVKSGTGSSNIKIYSNGTAIGTGTYATALANATQPFYVGGIINGISWNGTNYFNGFIDDLRITKGVARYTANFTPQTSQWQDQ